jgi:hypothetical protein
MRFLLALAIVALIQTIPGFSSAGKKNKAGQPPPLSLGGSTVAGPSGVALSDGASVSFLRSADVFTLCVTAANAGPGTLRIQINDSNQQSQTQGDILVQPGIPKTVCADGDSVRATCVGIGDCPFSWRGDAA